MLIGHFRKTALSSLEIFQAKTFINKRFIVEKSRKKTFFIIIFAFNIFKAILNIF